MDYDQIIKDLKHLHESNKIEEAHEVDDLLNAWNAWVFLKEQKKITTVSLCKAHQLMLPEESHSGAFRKCAVYINKRVKPNLGTPVITSLVRDFLNDSYYRKEKPDWLELSLSERLEQCRDSHVTFEKIHPFQDGNGRIGRMLYYLQAEMNMIEVPLISQNDVTSYYSWFD